MHKHQATTLLAEVAVGIGVVIIAVLYATYGPFSWMPQRKWITFGIITLGAFGVPAWWYRQYWTRAVFWAWFATLLAIHIVSYSIVLKRLGEFPPVLAATSVPLEWLVIFPILRKTVRGASERVPRDGGKRGGADPRSVGSVP
jgi:hypothetical protein